MITTSRQISTHFHSSEFRCQHCGVIKIDRDLVMKLENIFSKLNASKCIVTSGYRCDIYDVRVGGFKGRHYEGLAADVAYYDKEGKIIPSKIVCCVAKDLGELNGIAKINDNYTHLDNRKNWTYYGDETVSNSSLWTDPYKYFGVTKSDVAKYTGEKVVAPTKKKTYQSHGLNKKWYGNVAFGGTSNTDTNTFAGVIGVAMDGLYIDDLEYRVKTNGRWLPAVTGRSDYAGILGSQVTDVAIKGATYRVHIKGGKWLPWVTGYNINDYSNGYAGNGKIIDAIQIK